MESKKSLIGKVWQNYSKDISMADVGRVVVMPLKKNTQMVNKEIDLLCKKDFFENIDVLEVGGGFGNFCKTLQERIDIKSYTLLDIPQMLKIAKDFLKDIPCNYVEVKDYKTLFNKKFDLFVSNICLSEVPKEYGKELANNIFPNCKHAFIIDINKERRDPYNLLKWLPQALNKHFDKVEITDASRACFQPNHNLYYAYHESWWE